MTRAWIGEALVIAIGFSVGDGALEDVAVFCVIRTGGFGMGNLYDLVTEFGEEERIVGFFRAAGFFPACDELGNSFHKRLGHAVILNWHPGCVRSWLESPTPEGVGALQRTSGGLLIRQAHVVPMMGGNRASLATHGHGDSEIATP